MSGVRPDEIFIRTYGSTPAEALAAFNEKVATFVTHPAARTPMVVQIRIAANDPSTPPPPIETSELPVVLPEGVADPGHAHPAFESRYFAEGKLWVWRRSSITFGAVKP